MAAVTVLGAGGSTVSLTYDSQTNAVIAGQLASAISDAVRSGSLLPATDTSGAPPRLPAGSTGEFVQTLTGVTVLPTGYKAIVNAAANAVILGSSGNQQSVLSGNGG